MAQPYDESEVLEGEVIPFQPRTNRIPYQRAPVVRRQLPLEPRRSGPLGIFVNRQDQDHLDAELKIEQLESEAHKARFGAIRLAVTGVQESGEAGDTIERVHNMHDPESLGGRLTADIGGRAAARIRDGFDWFLDIYQSEVTNILHRRR